MNDYGSWGSNSTIKSPNKNADLSHTGSNVIHRNLCVFKGTKPGKGFDNFPGFQLLQIIKTINFNKTPYVIVYA